MIRITVTGGTYPIRKVLKEHKFQYNHPGRSWYRAVKETDLNRVLDSLRPEYHPEHKTPEINVKLESVDKNENLNREGVMRITLTPEDAKAGEDYYQIFKREACNQIVTNDLNESPASSDSGTKEKKWKELPKNEMETHYGIIRQDNSVMNIYWYESKEYVQKRMNNFVEVDKNRNPIRMIAVQIID